MDARNTDHAAVDAQRAAHLDRGWELLEHGDPAGARAAALEAQTLDPDAPEPQTLLGAIAHAEGDPDEALRHYRTAMNADPDYLDPILFAAEVLLEPAVFDAEEALRLSEQALDLAEEEEEYLDATLLRAEALAARGASDEAVHAVEDLPDVDLPEPSYHLRAAALLLDLGHLDAAERHYRRALTLDPESADGHHGLGLVLQDRGEHEAMVEELLRARTLDLAAPRPPWRLSTDRFAALARSAVAELPLRARDYVAGAPLETPEAPVPEDVAEGLDPRQPIALHTRAGSPPLLERVSVYQRNVERLAGSPDEARDEIRSALLMEVGALLGLEEADLLA